MEKEMATHASIPAWGISMDRGACSATVHGVATVRQDLVTKPPPPRYIRRFLIEHILGVLITGKMYTHTHTHTRFYFFNVVSMRGWTFTQQQSEK